MDLSVHPQDDNNIRKIEDIIDIQKAKGNFSFRQVAFNLPSESNSTGSTSLTKSLESGLSNEKSKEGIHKKLKRLRSKRAKSPLPDVTSWPSDSDITVLRMKLCLTSSDLKENVGNVFLGDGLHQPDSSSMVNLATMILQSQSPSKHSMSLEEYLLPLTSWEHQHRHDTGKDLVKEEKSEAYPAQLDTRPHEVCSRQDDHYYSSPDSDCSQSTKKSKMARFLRLYFCPCCTCLYRLEKMREEPSACFTKRKEAVNI